MQGDSDVTDRVEREQKAAGRRDAGGVLLLPARRRSPIPGQGVAGPEIPGQDRDSLRPGDPLPEESGEETGEAPAPCLSAPALVGVAALSILAGYEWLHVLPDGPLRAVPPLVVVGVAPVTFALTRGLGGPEGAAPRLLARSGSLLVLCLGLVVSADPGGPLTLVLGAAALFLAASLAALVVASERHRRPPARTR